MKNNKGFTLVELLAMLVVLGVLMAVVVPNMTGILGQQKKDAVEQDAIKMINAAKMTFTKNKKIKKPGKNQCVLFSLNYLDTNNDFEKGGNGGTYEQFDSFVIVKRVNNKYVYFVRINEDIGNGKHVGIPITTEDKLTSGENTEYGDITEVTLRDGTVGATNAFNASHILREKCTYNGSNAIINYYK